MKKSNKTEKLNLLFSAFLIIAFVVCGYFFSELALTLASPWNAVVGALIFVLFGLFLFYATRVGDGKQIFRFSASSLILVLLPSLYIILASMVSSLPLYEQISGNSVVSALAGVAFGYGLPYTFISGFELKTEDEEDEFKAGESEESETENPTENGEETEAEQTGEEDSNPESAEDEQPEDGSTEPEISEDSEDKNNLQNTGEANDDSLPNESAQEEPAEQNTQE